jgi:hypothetical protein
MPLLSVSDLLTVTTAPDALNLELSIAAGLGMPTTAWQPISVEMTILAVNAQIVASYSVAINQIAAGGFPTTAATIPATSTNNDGNGFFMGWEDLCLLNYYNIIRNPVTFATGNFTVNNVSAIGYGPFTPGTLHFQHPITGATYSNTGTVSISGSTSGQTIAVQADAGFPGNAGTIAAGVTPILLTALSGVQPQPVSTSLVGNNIETNASALLRGQAKLGSLSPNGASQAYTYVASTVPVPANRATAVFPFNELVDATNTAITVSSPITRVATQLNPITGTVGVYVANAAGAPSGADILELGSAIQALSVPLSVTAFVAAVGTLALDLFFNVYVKTSSGLSSAQVLANIDAAVQVFCQNTPIGGYTTTTANIIPFDLLVETIMNANPGTQDLQLLNPAGDLAISTTAVPVPGTRNPASQVFFV